MTGSIPDPRLEAVAERLGMTAASHWRYAIAERVLAAADAADEASGVRRVTAQELADQLELARAEERQRWVGLVADLAPEVPMNQDEMGGCVWCHWPGDYEYATADPSDHSDDCAWVAARSALSAADSPVGGVS